MRILVCGSRVFNDYNSLEQKLSAIVKPDDIIIQGGAVGADSLAGLFARSNGNQCIVVKPKWDLYGRSAGFKRNIEMLNMLDCNDLVVAFIVNNSQGSMHTVEQAKLRGIKTIVFDYQV